MKTELLRRGAAVWRLISEVPGRPDASSRVRVFRALPLLVPAVAILVLGTWVLLVQRPALAARRGEQQTLLALEARVEELKLRTSDDDAAQAMQRAAATAQTLPGSADDLTPVLRQLRARLREQGWECSFQLGDNSLETAPKSALLAYLPAKARLAPLPALTQPLPGLLLVLETLPSGSPRTDVTRLAIRADDAGRYAVDLNLRFGARPQREKAP